MNGYIETAVGVFQALPGVIQAGKGIWKLLKPPKTLATLENNDGISERTYYSKDYKFSIAIPDDDWEFWRPSTAFLASMGPEFNLPTRAMPIIIFSKKIFRLFRPNVNVTVESVGDYTNIEEMVRLSEVMLRKAGVTLDAADIHIDNIHQSGVLISSQPHLTGTMYQVQQQYLVTGMLYTVTASYVPLSDLSKGLFGGLQEIMNSFKFIEA